MAESTQTLIASELRGYLADAGATFYKKDASGRYVYKTPTGVWITVTALGGSRVKVQTMSRCNCS